MFNGDSALGSGLVVGRVKATSPSAFRQGVLGLAFVSFICLALLLALGVRAPSAVLFSLSLGIQIAGGASLWLMVRGPSSVGTAECLGVGLALGSVSAVLLAQIVSPLGLGEWAFLGAGLLPLSLWVIPSTRNRLLTLRSSSPSTLQFVSLLLFGLALSVFVLLPFFLTNPEIEFGFIRYHQDIPFFEGLTHGVIAWGGSEKINLAGGELRYHWFTYAWSGWEANISRAEPFAVLTRMLPVTAAVGICLMTIAAAQAMSRRVSTSVLALGLITLGTGIASFNQFGQIVTPLSPSQLLTTLWLMAAAFVLISYVERRSTTRGGLAVIAILSFGCTGGKISAGAVLCGATLAVGLTAMVQRAKRVRSVLALLSVGASTICAFVLFIAPDGNNQNVNGLQLGPGLAVLLNVPPSEILAPSPHFWWIAVTVGGFIVLNAKDAGLLLIRPRSTLAFSLSAALGAMLVGTLLSMIFYQSGNSHIYFILASGAIAGPVAAVGLTKSGLTRDQGFRRGTLLSIAAGALAASFTLSLTLKVDVSRLFGLRHVTFWAIAPIAGMAALLLFLAGLTFTLHRRELRTYLVRLNLYYAAAFLTSMAISTGIGFGTVNLQAVLNARSTLDSDYSTGYGWTNDHAEALQWLRDSSNPEDVLATNRFCPTGESPPTCDSRSFIVSALTGRKMLVEGYSYSIGLDEMPLWAAKRVEASIDFALAPSANSFVELESYGVTWVVIDNAFPHAQDWMPFARVAFSNDAVSILHLS